MPAQSHEQRLRFGPFEADLSTGELWKHGRRVKLQDQPFEVLAILLARPRQLVSREELRQTLWPRDTFVDFDAGLNAAIKRLRDALHDSPDNPRYVETLPRRGYRFIGALEVAAQPAAQELRALPEPDDADRAQSIPPIEFRDSPSSMAPKIPRNSWRWKIAVACTVLVAAGIGTSTWRSRLIAERKNVGRIRSIAVLPLQNLSGDPAQEYFAEGMTDALITDLAQSNSLLVISATSSMRYRNTTKAIHDIGRELHIDAVIEGAVVRSGDEVRIDAQLIRTADDRHLWAKSYQRKIGDVLALQADIALAIADEVQLKLTPRERARLTRTRAINPDAYDAYLLGQYFLERAGKDNLQKARDYYQQAIQLDPNYALAWAGLADAQRLLVGGGFVPEAEGFRLTRKAVERALTLDPDLAEAHAAMGSIHMFIDWDWAGAESSYNHALALEPGNISALRGLASLAAFQCRYDKALALARSAVDRDPLDPRSHRLVGSIARNAGRLEEAAPALKRSLELNPQGAMAHLEIGLLYLAQSRPRDALAVIENEPGPDWRLFGLALVYHSLGSKTQSDIALAELIEKYRDAAAFQIATVYAFRGQSDQAFHWLDRAYTQRDGALATIEGDPLLDGIKQDPRYFAFLKKMRLPV